MAFRIRMGVPEDGAFWNDRAARKLSGHLDKDEQRFFKKLVKALGFLAENPCHPGLASHEIDDLTRQYGIKIFQSYLENKTPAAGRLFWEYGPEPGDMTVLAFEPHPEDQKRGADQRIKLSALPPRRAKPDTSKGTKEGQANVGRTVPAPFAPPMTRLEVSSHRVCAVPVSPLRFAQGTRRAEMKSAAHCRENDARTPNHRVVVFAAECGRPRTRDLCR